MFNDCVIGEICDPPEQNDSPSLGNGQSQGGCAMPSSKPSSRVGGQDSINNSHAPSVHNSSMSKTSSHHEISSAQILPRSKQIEGYKNKEFLLNQELQILKEQRNKLRGNRERASSPDTKRFLEENAILQSKICKKLNVINDVVHMLSGIMKKGVTPSQDSSSVEQKPNQKGSQKFAYACYDPGMHWCKDCNEYLSTITDYLNHLHSPTHEKMAAEHVEAPKQNLPEAYKGYRHLPNASTKRKPIRGVQFLVPVAGWFCKLCDLFTGDLQCTLTHMESVMHSRKYNEFVQQNPTWDADRMSDRQLAPAATCAKHHKHDILGNSKTCSVECVARPGADTKHFSTKHPTNAPPAESEDKKRHSTRPRKYFCCRWST